MGNVAKIVHDSNLCNYSTAHANHLHMHMFVHTKEKPYNCNQCDYKTAFQGHLNKHVLNVHTSKKLSSPRAGLRAESAYY